MSVCSHLEGSGSDSVRVRVGGLEHPLFPVGQDVYQARSGDVSLTYWVTSRRTSFSEEELDDVAHARDALASVELRVGVSYELEVLELVRLRSDYTPDRPPRAQLHPSEDRFALFFRLYRKGRLVFTSPSVEQVLLHVVMSTPSFEEGMLLVLYLPIESLEPGEPIGVLESYDAVRERLRVRFPWSRRERAVSPLHVSWFSSLSFQPSKNLYERLGAYARTLEAGQQARFQAFLREHGVSTVRVNLAALAP